MKVYQKRLCAGYAQNTRWRHIEAYDQAVDICMRTYTQNTALIQHRMLYNMLKTLLKFKMKIHPKDIGTSTNASTSTLKRV